MIMNLTIVCALGVGWGGGGDERMICVCSYEEEKEAAKQEAAKCVTHTEKVFKMLFFNGFKGSDNKHVSRSIHFTNWTKYKGPPSYFGSRTMANVATTHSNFTGFYYPFPNRRTHF